MPSPTVQDVTIPYEPTEIQQKVHQSQAKWKILKWGRGTGKSRCGVNEGIKNYLDWMSLPRRADIEPKLNFMTMGPTYEAAAQPWLEMKAFIEPLKEFDLVINIREDDRKINLYLPDGECIWEVKSADRPESALGRGIDYLWLTEAARIPGIVWDRDLRAMLLRPFRLGHAVIEGVPYGDDNYFEKLFARGQQPDADIESWHATSFDNPYMDKDLVMKQLETMAEHDWREQFLAETMADITSVFQNIDACAVTKVEEPVKDRAYVMGLDLGRKVDWTVPMILDRERRRAVYMERFSKSDWTIQKNKIMELWEKWGKPLVAIDVASIGGPIADDLRKSGVRLKEYNLHSPAEKQRIIQRLALAMQKETVHFPKSGNFIHLYKELRLYKEFHTTKSGLALKNINFRAPYGEHDDCVMSLALGLDACLRAGGWSEPIRAIVPMGAFPK